MVGRAYTFSRLGMCCNLVEVEVDIKKGLPNIQIAGLLSQEVRESKERIMPAISNSGIEFPLKRITINLSPAETVKIGTHYDLAIAAAILKIIGIIFEENNTKTAYFGELNLSGEIKWIRGIIPLVLEAKNNGFEKIFIPYDNYPEILFLNDNTIIPVNSINDLINKIDYDYFKDCVYENKLTKLITCSNNGEYLDIMGQKELINAYKIAASGHHHMILIGPPGSGKTMSASRMPSIMPDLVENEIIEINKIYSIVGLNKNKSWITKRPFRSPHNSSSSRAIIGGGPKVIPGEISLAHKGILFLDEFLEFRSDTLQALRTVIEKKEVYISMRNGSAFYPADFLLVAASNPCPCGFYGTKEGYCSCSLNEIKKYKKKLRNPLIDRIDLQVKVERINYKNLIEGKKNESSLDIKKEVIKAKTIQYERYNNETFYVNSEIPPEKISKYCILENGGESLLEKYVEENLLTARSCHKILRIARTISDLNGHELISNEDIQTAFKYRFLDIEEI